MPQGRKRKNYSNQDIKKILATFVGDEAIEVELLEKSFVRYEKS